MRAPRESPTVAGGQPSAAAPGVGRAGPDAPDGGRAEVPRARWAVALLLTALVAFRSHPSSRA